METKIGVVTHYFTNIGVAVFDLTDGNLAIGDSVHIQGATTDLSQVIESIQINQKDVEEAKVGQQIGVKTDDRVRVGDEIYLVTTIEE